MRWEMCASHFHFCTKQFHALCLILLASCRLQRPSTHDAASASCIESMHFKGVSIIPICICNVLVFVFSGKVRCKNDFYKSKIFSQVLKTTRKNVLQPQHLCDPHTALTRPRPFCFSRQSFIPLCWTWYLVGVEQCLVFPKEWKEELHPCGDRFFSTKCTKSANNLLFFSSQNSVWWSTEQWTVSAAHNWKSSQRIWIILYISLLHLSVSDHQICCFKRIISLLKEKGQ